MTQEKDTTTGAMLPKLYDPLSTSPPGSLWRRVLTYLPRLTIIETLTTYKKEYIIPDLTAGLLSTVMLVPQSLAYATLGKIYISVSYFQDSLCNESFSCHNNDSWSTSAVRSI